MGDYSLVKSVNFSVAVINAMTQSNLGRRRFISYICSHSPSLREVKKELKAGTMGEHRSLAHSLVHVWLAFMCSPGTLVWVWCCPQWLDPPASINSQGNAPTHAHGSVWWWKFFSWGSFLSDNSILCQVDGENASAHLACRSRGFGGVHPRRYVPHLRQERLAISCAGFCIVGSTQCWELAK